MSIRVVIVEPQALVLDAMRALLCGHFEVLATASDGETALSMAQRLQPEVLLLELSLPRLDGLALASRLRAECPNVRCMFVTQHADLGHTRAAFAAGAFGYVVKHATASELREAVRRVASGETYISAGLAQDSTKVPPRTLTSHGSGGLTLRQQEVLCQVALGRTGKEIAHRLGISLKTVESHRTNIGRQLGLRSSAGFTRYAVQRGLISFPGVADELADGDRSEGQGGTVPILTAPEPAQRPIREPAS